MRSWIDGISIKSKAMVLSNDKNQNINERILKYANTSKRFM